MSSLAAAGADNFYYPPGFDPDKHGSLNKVLLNHIVDSKCQTAISSVQPAATVVGAHADVALSCCSWLQFQGQHALRDRARKLGEGILIIR